jgi:hypothetical protein
MCPETGPPGIVRPGDPFPEERSDLEDICAMWAVSPEGSPRRAGLLARIRRHPDWHEPDPARTPQSGLDGAQTGAEAIPELAAVAKLPRVSSRPADDERAWRRISPADEEDD